MRPTIRRGVLAALLAAQLVTVLVLVITAGRISADAEADHTEALLDTAAAEAVDHTRNYVAPADSLVATTADMIRGGAVDTEAMERAFLGELQRTPQLSSVYIGTDDGSFFFVSRESDGFLVKEISVEGDRRDVLLRHLDETGAQTGSESMPDDPFDPRDRPWFQDGAVDGSRMVQWTAPYVFFTSEQLGVTASAAARTSDGSVVVVGADIELGSLSEFLAEFRVGPSGGAVIVDESNTVLAHPDPSLVQNTSSGTATTVDVSELDDPRARAAVGSLISAGAGAEPSSTTYESEAGSGQAAFRTLTVGSGTWTIGVHAPEGSLVQSLTDARRDERLLMIGVGIVSLLVLAAIALPATRSLTHLERRATLDSLTGLLNRGTVLDEGERIAREPGMHATIMIDLDHFKSINDTHGHPVGDEVIEEIGARISGALRSTDRAGRVGGEEFLVVIGETSAARAVEVAERIRGAIRDTPIITSAGELQMTASIGMSIARGPTELQRSLAVADTALLEAKQDGRDRLVSGGVVGAPVRG